MTSITPRPETLRRDGGCLCGAVRVSARVETEVQACHCVQCQRWTGGGPLFCVPVSDVTVIGEDALTAYRASDWGERLFCATCGSTVLWRMQDRPINYLAVGLFDDQTGLRVTDEIFIDHRAPWLPPFPGAAESSEAQEMVKLDAFLTGATL
ncbi:MAG: GFA family protein [Pseudomonadota bacterium]